MLRDNLFKCGVTAISLTGMLAGAAAFASQPDDGAGAFHSRHYRNLFAERLGRSPEEVHRRIEHTFQQLFHGDGQEQRVYFETGANDNGPLAYITDWANNDARTEGMSYGMMIAVQLDKKREFDALWNWSKTYMLVTDPDNPSRGYFAWSMNTDGTPRSVIDLFPWQNDFFLMILNITPTNNSQLEITLKLFCF